MFLQFIGNYDSPTTFGTLEEGEVFIYDDIMAEDIFVKTGTDTARCISNAGNKIYKFLRNESVFTCTVEKH